ncbi:hypothetical protein DQ04_05051060 [Trypanosoma grayi]|uniref:hypothetical protein n=1 Tax=Trypanosoma grayi TaxID=71804 RepID=UPI0004F3FCCA|nr:hypothetical protein DQ04_05051060 [Trypanosoma grayi]KEG09548.1 hypothetical protein DQ04_05051060 [Trypanosoma grayi]
MTQLKASHLLPPRLALIALTLTLVALPSLQLCSAEAGMADLVLGKASSPVEQLQRHDMRWHAATRSRGSTEWSDVGEAHVNAPAGERVVTVTMASQLGSLQCEESRRNVGGLRHGRCTLQPTPALHDDVFFSYRVSLKGAAADVGAAGADGVSRRGKLYKEGSHENSDVEVGTVTFKEDGHNEKAAEGLNGAIILEFDTTNAAHDQVEWLPGALRLTGLSLSEVEVRDWRRRAATTMLERWGCPVLVVATLCGVLFFMGKVANRQAPTAVKPKQA